MCWCKWSQQILTNSPLTLGSGKKSILYLMQNLGDELCIVFGVKTTAQPGLLCVLILQTVLLLTSLGWDSRCSAPVLWWAIFNKHLSCMPLLLPKLSSCFFPAESSLEASSISRRWQWRDTREDFARSGRGTAELSNCLHTNEMSQSFYLFVFILTLASPGITVIFFRMSLPCAFAVHWFL